MATFSTEAQIDAAPAAVWDVLADIGSIHAWNPGVVDSRVTSDVEAGVGSSRHCDLGGRNYLDEDVVEWEPNEAITFRIVGSNMPFATADIAFRLRSQGDTTTVTVSPDYTLKFGPLGRLMDAVMVRRMYRKGMEQMLAGLKAHVEAAP
ncbi:SRPBCC family protein [Candidatus Poribacteria bacterium]|nr:SRPBCC family protein [Candidatus Poribacteria bacterium]MBT5534820.1 SRPBCC family protein [Candidatus Poribacteria bacterium]MBT5710147.1 SRPBCC family protein [Candidatus Poribacteria bacterium]MBT7806953.1 SRPBCC family protein [Candidatus Poribacteria bacterium]